MGFFQFAPGVGQEFMKSTEKNVSELNDGRGKKKKKLNSSFFGVMKSTDSVCETEM